MQISRISLIAGSLTFAGMTAWLPAQSIEKKDLAAEVTASEKSRVRVVVDRLNIRARPGTSYEVVAKVNRDQILAVVNKKGDWLEVLPPAGTAAWCAAKFIAETGTVTGHNVRVRSGPGIVFSAYATLPEGTSVTPVGTPVGEWQQIKVPGNATVWVHGNYVAPVQTLKPQSAAGETSHPASSSPEETGEISLQKDQTTRNLTAIKDGASRPEKHSDSKQTGHDIISSKNENDAEKDRENDAEKAPPAATEGARLPPLIDSQDAISDDTVSPSNTLPPPLTEKQAEEPSATGAPVESEKTGAVQPAIEDDSATDEGQRNKRVVQPKIIREGTLISLKSKATAFVTHALIRRQCDKSYLVCYLISTSIDLNEWENRGVRIYGQPLDYAGWETEALQAVGVQLLLPE